MALTAANARVAVTGALYWDKAASATAPTSSSSVLAAGFKDLGYVSEDGVTLTMPDSGEATPLKVWQGGATIRVIRTPSDDSPQISLTLVETKLEVIEAAFGVTVTQSVADGAFEYDITDTRSHGRLVLDVVDGAELIRVYGPYGIVTSLGEINLTSTDLIGYNLTFDLERDATAAYNFKSWMTALKS